MQTRFNVSGITCGSCAAVITNALDSLPAEKKFFYIDNEPVPIFKSAVNVLNKQLIVTFHEKATEFLREQSKKEIIDSLSIFDFVCTEEEKEEDEGIIISLEKEPLSETTNLINHPSIQVQLNKNPVEENQQSKKNNSKNEDALFDPLKWLLNLFGIEISSEASHAIQAFFGIAAGLISMGLMLSGLVLPAMVINILMGFNTTLTLFLGLGSYYAALKKLWSLDKLSKLGWKGMLSVINMHLLFAFSTLLIIGVSIASLFVPGLHSMIDASLLIYGFMHMGEVIRHSIKEEAKAGSLYEDRCEPFVDKKNGDDYESCPSSQLKPGDVIRIKPGMVIPVDGRCNGNGSIQTDLFGDSRAQIIPENGYIAAGSIARNEFEMTVTKAMHESYLADQKNAALAGMDNAPAPIEDAATQFLQYLLPAVLLLAVICGGLLAYLVGPHAALQIIILLLVSVCPCSLGLLTPLAIQMGMTKTYDHGFYFKSATDLQMVKDCDTVAFDLNGTGTMGEHKILDWEFFDDVSEKKEKKLLGYFAMLEKNSDHAMAQLIYKEYEDNIIENTDIKITNEMNSGRTAIMDKNEYMIGSADYLALNEIKLPKEIQAKIADELEKDENPFQAIYLVENRQVIGYIKVCDPIRDESQFVIDELREKNKEIFLLTGADRLTALAYAKKFKIPPEKVRYGYPGFRRPQDIDQMETKPELRIYTENKNIKPGKLYLHREGKKISYKFLNAQGVVITEVINDEKIIAPEEFNLTNLKNLEPQIIAYASNAGHIPDKTKVSFAYELMNGGRKLMVVGDSGNDAVVLSANGCFGVAINSSFSKPETRNNAKAVVRINSILPVLGIFAIAEETIDSIMTSIFGSQVFNVAAVAVSIGLTVAGFMINPAIGASMMFLQMIFFFSYLLYVHSRPMPYEEKYNEQLANQSTNSRVYKHQNRMGMKQEKNNRNIKINDDLITNVDNEENNTVININSCSESESDGLSSYTKVSLIEERSLFRYL